MFKIKNVPNFASNTKKWFDILNDVKIKKEYKIYSGILLFTGCRCSEGLSVRREDFSINGNPIVRLPVLKKRVSTFRIVPIPYILYDLAMNSNFEKFNFTRRTAYRVIKRIFNCNPHALRHSFALSFLEMTKNIAKTQQVLGHSSINTTANYLLYKNVEIYDDIIKMQKIFLEEALR